MIKKHGALAAWAPYILLNCVRFFVSSDEKNNDQMKNILDVIHPDGLDVNTHWVAKSSNSLGRLTSIGKIRNGFIASPAALQQHNVVMCPIAFSSEASADLPSGTTIFPFLEQQHDVSSMLYNK